MILQFAARNIFRHRARSAMTLAVIAFGVAALIISGGFVQDLYRHLAEAIIHSQSGHIQAAQPAFFGERSRSPEKNLIKNLDAVKADLANLPGVKRVMARINFVGLLSNGRSDLPIIGEGVEPDKEAELATSINMLAGRALASRDRAGAMVGEGLAKSLDLKPGSAVTLVATTADGAMNTSDFEVIGVFRSFSKDYDARAIKVPLDAAQDLMGTPTANTVVVLLDDTAKTESIVRDATPAMQARGLALRSWEQLNDFYSSTVQLYDRQFGVLKLIILFMVALGITNAVNMAVFERLGEFGTMRALGNRGREVFRLVMAECLLLGAVGAVAGVAVGIALALIISAVGIPMPPPPNSNIGFTASIAVVPGIIAEALAVGLVAAVLAGIIPALRAQRVAIVDALRQGV